MTRLSHDYEWKSNEPIEHGLDRYFAAEISAPLLYAYRFDDGPIKLWDASEGLRFPKEVDEALLDPAVEKWGFNNSFERLASQRRLGRKIDPAGWRCTMSLAYSLSFIGGLGDVGAQLGLPVDKQKDASGKKLIRLFCVPQKPTKNQPHVWCDWRTHPAEWQEFRAYCVQDVEAEDAIKAWLLRFPIAANTWMLYEIDQAVNDAGLPLDLQFVDGAIALAERRKTELSGALNRLTGLDNTNSTAQFLPWLRERGYPFADLMKDTVVRVLVDDAEKPVLTDDARAALLIRQQVTRSSVKKYDAMRERAGADGVLRGCFQFAGASRTLRWAGRGVQPQNFPRTPKLLEAPAWLDVATDAIREQDMDMLELLVGEPMDALAGCVRSAIRAPDGYAFVVCDLASIESRVVGWVSRCARLMNVFAEGRDTYKDFATVLFNVPYEAVTKKQRSDSKPATLGVPYGLGGGDIVEGKKTGLWGYAAAMGINLTREVAHDSVRKFKDAHPEIEELWRALDKASHACLKTKKHRPVNDLLSFDWLDPFIVLNLPSGRPIYYKDPSLGTFWFAKHPRTHAGKALGQDEQRAMRAKEKGWDVYSRTNLLYYGKPQNRPGWMPVATRGAKLVENLTQAIARDILADQMIDARDAGFDLRLHAHDELLAVVPEAGADRAAKQLREIMSRSPAWAPDLKLDAHPFVTRYYRKD
jgi:DNA polymerase